MNIPGDCDNIETIILRDNPPTSTESRRLDTNSQQTYRVEAYIVPAVNSPALPIDNEIEERIANRLKITDKGLFESDTLTNEKKMPFILHKMKFAKFPDKNESINGEITEYCTSETTLDTLFEEDELCGKEELMEKFFSCNKTPDVIQNVKFEARSQLSRDTLYPSRQFRKTNSLPAIDEKCEYSVSNKRSNFCQHGYRNGCTATFVPPEEISSGIFKRNCLEKIEILQQWEADVTEREINMRKKEKEIFMMQKELRIAARVLSEKLKQVDQYMRCQRSMQIVDRKLIEVTQVLSGELQKRDRRKEHKCQSKDSDGYKKSCAHKGSSEHPCQAGKPEYECCDVSNLFDEIMKFNEFIELNEVRRANEAEESDEFKSDKVKRSCAHKAPDEQHPRQAGEFKSGENPEVMKLDEIKTPNEYTKRDDVRRPDETKKSDVFETFDGELKKSSDDDFRTSNESTRTGRWRNSQSLVGACEEKESDTKTRRSLHSRVHSSRQSTANSKVRVYSSLRYKERPKVSYDDLNSTLSADPGDSSFVRTSEQFLPHVYKKPSAFTRSASVRSTRRRDGAIVSKPQETIDVETPDCNIEEKKVLRRFSENIQASQDKNTKFQHYGLVDRTPRDIQQHNSHNQRVFSYLNLDVGKHIRCKPENSVPTTRPKSCNIEMDAWLQKKRLAYTLATRTKPSDDKENLGCNIVTGKGKKEEKVKSKSSKKKKKILTIFG